MDDVYRDMASKKIVTRDELRSIVGNRPRDKSVIICHGTFDVVHPGHVRHLMYAKSKADILVASLTCDRHVTKADMRPYVPEDLRAINLAAFEMVDYVIVDDNPTPIATIKSVKPDFFAKGYEYVDGHIPPKTQEEIDALETYGGEIIFTPGDIVYSSSHFIETSPPNIAADKLSVLMDAEGFTIRDLSTILDAFPKVKVHVIGDLIVDSLTHCSVIGGMTKTPTMSVRYEGQDDYVGGAGIVAKHVAATGAEVTFSTVLGDDKLAHYALTDLEKDGVQVLPIIDRTRPTTNKNAIVANDYRLIKIDTLDNRSISKKIVQQLRAQIQRVDADIVVFSDFRHGIFNKHTIDELVDAIPEKVFKVADSQVASRWGNITEFKGFDLITPNEREARFALADQDSVVRPLAQEIYRVAECKTLILKLGKRGSLTYRTRPEGDPRTIISVDSFATDIVDAVGAGDALLAYASLALFASEGNEAIATVLGNIAAGLECGYDGNKSVSPSAVRKRLLELEQSIHYGETKNAATDYMKTTMGEGPHD